MSTAEESQSSKHAVTIETEVTRSISVDDVRRYVIRKGFRFGNRQGPRGDGCELYTLASVGEMTEFTPCVFLFDDPSQLRIAVNGIANALDRPADEVLREVAGEVVTLTDALEALFVALAAMGVDDGGRHGDLTDLAFAMRYATKWREIPVRSYANVPPPLLRAVVEAAEDLTAIALAAIRAARRAPPVEGPTS